jgi:hypothetical protein
MEATAQATLTKEAEMGVSDDIALATVAAFTA